MSGRHREPVSGRHRAEPHHRRAATRAATLAVATAIVTISIGGRFLFSSEAVDAAGPVADDQPTTHAPSRTPSAVRQAIGGPTPHSTRSRATRAPSGVRIPAAGSGDFRVAAGQSTVVGAGARVTYTVEVEAELPFHEAAVARIVEGILGDKRGWTAVMSRSLQRVPSDPDIHLRFATPVTTDRLCAPLDTGGRLSCRNGDLVVLNAWRWVHGADAYTRDLADYRRYMVNHEVGHALGRAHQSCPGPGQFAPVMVQQTKGLDGCKPNPWPLTAAVTMPHSRG